MFFYWHTCAFIFVQFFIVLIPHSHQSLTCLKSGVDYSRFIGNDTAEELITPPLTLFIPGFLAGVVPERGVFHLHPVTPLSLKSDDSNFVQNRPFSFRARPRFQTEYIIIIITSEALRQVI